jgi:hypothetical protein
MSKKLTLRKDIKRPLTIQEIDENFEYLQEKQSNVDGTTIHYNFNNELEVLLSGGLEIESITVNNLRSLVNNFDINKIYRLIDFRSYNYNGVYGNIETLLVFPINNNTLKPIAYSEDRQRDIIYYNLFLGEYGHIGRRIDTNRNVDVPFDFIGYKYDSVTPIFNIDSSINIKWNDVFEYSYGNFINNVIGTYFENNIIGSGFKNNNIGYNFKNNNIGNNFQNNIISYNFQNNNIGNDSHDNEISNTFIDNKIHQFYNNEIGKSFTNNDIYIFLNNTVLDNFTNNICKNYFIFTNVGNNVKYNIFNYTIGVSSKINISIPSNFIYNIINTRIEISEDFSDVSSITNNNVTSEIFKDSTNTLRIKYVDGLGNIQINLI